MEIGMIGVGRMGSAMARNLIKAGHSVYLYDAVPDGPRSLEKEGGHVVASAKDAFRGDVCITMLSNDDAMRSVFIDGGLPLQGARTIHMNMATASVAMAQELAAHHKERGVPYVAACVWGRPDVAAAAKLSIVAAGEKAAVDKVEPLFKVIGQRHTIVGTDPVMANVAKIAGNLMVAAAIEAMGEAAALVRAYGLNSADFLTMVNTALFDVPVYRGYGDAIGNSKYEPPGFDLTLGFKDVRLALAASEKKNVPLPFANVLRDAFLDAIAHGDSKKDWAAIATVAARRAGLD